MTIIMGARRFQVQRGSLSAALVFLWSLNVCAGADSDDAMFFHEQVAPLLVKNCIECHNANTHKGKLNLESLAAAITGGEDGAGVVPGKPLESLLYTRIVPESPGEKPEMPKKKAPLSPEDVAKIRQWIERGALWPKEIVLKEKAKGDKTFWSFQPLAKAEPPVTEAASPAWQANPIDRFVFAKLAEKHLAPNALADPAVFIRRATYDLTGLPPSPEDVVSFVEAAIRDRQAAVVALIDHLLASPRYGEQWGRHWLDVIRFGESRGYERNEIIKNLWPFRDYIITAFNEDKPFDRLFLEHLAGDVIGAGKPESEIASAFLVAGPYDDVGNQDAVAAAQIRADELDEMVRATGEAFLGMTIGCARCHDHKFDPLLARDYYALSATFAGVAHGERVVATAEETSVRDAQVKPLQERQAALTRERDEVKGQADTPEKNARLAQLDGDLKIIAGELAKIPPLRTWWVGTHRPAAGPFNVFLGGNPQRKGDVVAPASLSVFDGAASAYRVDPAKPDGDRRVALATWLTAPDNPLTPRVLVNRIWHYHFGTGLVDTPSDFGYMGGRPTHPELLDWLARQLQRNHWQIKALHRLIMTSQAYQQSGDFRDIAARADGDSRLLWRFPPRRLSAEEVRDTLLTVAGKLDLTMGGPGFRLYEYQQDNVATYVPLDVHGPETYRRAVYHHNARAARVDVLTDFDAPDPAFAEPRRAATTTPLQALTLMNHRFALDMAQALAERLQREAGGSAVTSQVQRAFHLAYGRAAAADEVERATKLVAAYGLRAFCRALLNSTELISVN
jgi:mono/diheme cytochrome c family protein